MPRKLRTPGMFLLALALLITLWEGIARSFPNLLFVLPPPLAIFHTLWDMRARFWMHTSVTLTEMCCGFLLAASLAFPLAWCMLHFHRSRSLLQPLFIVIQCVPMFTLAPIMVVWFGWSYIAIIIPTALMIFFPLTLSVYQGLKSTPEDLLEFFRAGHATPWQTFTKLRLPFALPHIFAGVRISAAIAGVSAVAGEWAGAQKGLGVLMLESRRNTDLEITFAALLCLTLISVTLYLLTLLCEKMILRPKKWQLPAGMLVALALLFTGCSHDPAISKPTRLLLDWLPNPNHIPLYTGVEKGFFAEEGIDLLIQKTQESGGGISYLVSRQADLLVNHMPGTFKACQRGAKLKLVGMLIKEPLSGLIYRDSPDIHKPSDLSGSRFGYCIGVPEMDFIEFLLHQGEINPKEQKNVSVDLVTSLGTGCVDFIYGAFWNIEPFQFKALGVKTKIFKTQDFGIPTYYEMIILANHGSPEATEDFVLRFRRALQKSLDFCKAHPQEAFDCYLTCNQDRSPKTIAWQQEAWLTTLPLLATDQTVDQEEIRKFYDWQVAQGMISKEFDFQELTSIP